MSIDARAGAAASHASARQVQASTRAQPVRARCVRGRIAGRAGAIVIGRLVGGAKTKDSTQSDPHPDGFPGGL
jgi:hypothetical protein